MVETQCHGGWIGFEGACGAVIESVRGQDGNKLSLGVAVLMYICQCGLWLQAGELCHALASSRVSPNGFQCWQCSCSIGFVGAVVESLSLCTRNA